MSLRATTWCKILKEKLKKKLNLSNVLHWKEVIKFDCFLTGFTT